MSAPRPYVIAEAGVNHNGRIALARELVHAAKAAGADAVKFQTFIPEIGVLADTPLAEYQKKAMKTEASTMLEMVRTLALSFDEFRELQILCNEVGIDFMSTPFDRPSAQLMVALNPRYIKISSGDLDNFLLLEEVAKSRSQIIISTGMGTLAEIRAAVDFTLSAGAAGVCLLHCVSSYPAPIEVANVRAVRTLREQFGLVTGYSDHTTGFAAGCAAVALGAQIVEKHFTLDKAMLGPDHAFSLNPAEMAQFVTLLRESALSLGDGQKICGPEEQELRTLARRSIHMVRPMQAGSRLTMQDMCAIRPAGGLSPDLAPQLVGRTLQRDLGELERLSLQDLA
ncbi:N-acetylneuraminate synthase family protein [uncultured Ramlibacter sp.]|uniref:N-acetylneuraminate synthase family protein n=1 Tax=uncultured Ramlibacter sp. TaxID=260755 RepID=UPI0026175F60|nr:N-acetylneuraminate synthase family protein [uncultured Ramlibacter sp.]